VRLAKRLDRESSGNPQRAGYSDASISFTISEKTQFSSVDPGVSCSA
jgi:hypothetical protein